MTPMEPSRSSKQEKTYTGAMEIEGYSYLSDNRMEKVKYLILEQIECEGKPISGVELVQNVVRRYPTTKPSINEVCDALEELLGRNLP